MAKTTPPKFPKEPMPKKIKIKPMKAVKIKEPKTNIYNEAIKQLKVKSQIA